MNTYASTVAGLLLFSFAAFGCSESEAAPDGAGADAGRDTAVAADAGSDDLDAAPADADAIIDASGYPLVQTDAGLSVIDQSYVAHHFDELLAGTWLVGFFGGQAHLSWIRFQGGGMGGDVQVLGPADVRENVPYWDCSGLGWWMPTERPNTVQIALPSGCQTEILIFETLRPVASPGQAFLEARISACAPGACGPDDATEILAWKYPAAVCAADMTSCESPM